MKVKIRRWQAAATHEYDNVIDVYTKGDMLCLLFEDSHITKIPLVHIFDVQHDYYEAEKRDKKVNPVSSGR